MLLFENFAGMQKRKLQNVLRNVVKSVMINRLACGRIAE